jgi:hypothetical protein
MGARPEPARIVADLHKAALADDTGAALDTALSGFAPTGGPAQPPAKPPAHERPSEEKRRLTA